MEAICGQQCFYLKIVFCFIVEIKKRYCLNLLINSVSQNKLYPTSLQYPLINYLGCLQDFKKGRVQGRDLATGKLCKDLFDRRKRWIQYKFRKIKSLLVDMPLSKGGNSNCGNMWRQENIIRGVVFKVLKLVLILMK